MLSKQRWPKLCVLAIWAVATVSLPMACRERGPAEEAGREVDRGIEGTGDAIQDLGDEIEDVGRGR